MNTKRIIAILGLLCMFVSVTCIVVSGIFPALKDVLWMLALITFLLAATVSLFFYFRKQEESPDQEDEHQQDA